VYELESKGIKLRESAVECDLEEMARKELDYEKKKDFLCDFKLQ
jgi:hypothetical protein